MRTSNIHIHFLRKEPEKTVGREEQPGTAVDGTKHMIRTADKKILQRKIMSTQIELQRSPKKHFFPNKQTERIGWQVRQFIGKNTIEGGKNHFRI